MSTAQPLTPLDASFLHLETPQAHMQIGGIALFTPPRGKQSAHMYNLVVKTVADRIHLMPRYRQRLQTVPFRLGQPMWIDDDDFDLSHHIKHVHLDEPGDMDTLQNLAAQIFSVKLDRSIPLWEMTVVDGLSGNRWALISKTHHALVDGKSHLELSTVLFDLESTPPPKHRRPRWVPEPPPSTLDQIKRTAAELVEHPKSLFNRITAALEHPEEFTEELRQTTEGLYSLRYDLHPPMSPFNGQTSASRSFATCKLSLAQFKSIRENLGGTINDVVLAIVAGALRQYFLDSGWSFEHHDHLTTLCPVSLRTPEDKALMGNRLAMLFIPLPIAIADTRRRYSLIRGYVEARKALQQATGADFLLNLAGQAPAPIQQQVAQTSIKMMNFNLLVTNVPGPQFPIYFQGSTLDEVYPIAFLYDGQFLSVAVFSYNGSISFGVLGDANSKIAFDHLAEALVESADELEHLNP